MRNYRQSVFPLMEEDLHSCDFFDVHTEKNAYFGIVAGGTSGFIHFVDI